MQRDEYDVMISPTTDASVSTEFSAIKDNPTTVICFGLQGNEKLIVQAYNPFTNDFVDLPLTFISATDNPILTLAFDAGLYRVRKTATLSAVGVSKIQNINTKVIKLG